MSQDPKQKQLKDLIPETKKTTLSFLEWQILQAKLKKEADERTALYREISY
jgi:hypothetical protein